MSIAMAINMHFRMLELRRTNVEEAVHVRSIFNNVIAKDLQSVTVFEPPDLSGLEALGGNTAAAAAKLVESAASDPNLAALAGQMAGGNTGGGQPPGGQQGGGQATGGATQTAPAGGNQGGGTAQSAGASSSKAGGASSPNTGASGAAAGSSPAASGGSPAPTASDEAAPAGGVMGLYGTASELKFDVSRLPQLHQYDALLSSSGETAATDIPSDVKTIVYFLAGEDLPPDPRMLGPQDVLPSTTGIGRGLMRREIDRAVNSFAESNGDLTSIYSGSRLVSDKITGLAFQYYDGTAWVTDWDSDAMGGLPQAVEIVLTIEPTYGMTEAEIAELETEAPPPRTYRQVVKIPTARLAPPATTEETEAGASDATGSAAGGAGSPTSQGATP